MTKEKTGRGRDLFNKYSKLINFVVKLVSFIPFKLRLSFLRLFQNKNGYSGLVLRYILVKTIAKNCGINVSVFPGVYLNNIDNLSLGDNVSIHPMCYIDAEGGIEIGSDVSIAHGTTILSSTHNYDDIILPIKDQGMTLNKTIVKDNVWIGSKATILSGTIINTGSIVAANAVVTKNISDNSIVAGVPAKIIKSRM